MGRRNQRSTQPTPRLSGRAGVKQRERRLQRTNGLCEDCQAEGIIALATVVDHIIPLSNGGPDTDENTRNLCDDHDAKRTAEQFGYKAPKQPIGIDGRPRDPSHLVGQCLTETRGASHSQVSMGESILVAWREAD